MKYIDRLLNSITMYRLVVYGLLVLASLGVILAATGRLSFDPLGMILSLAVLMGAHYLTDYTLGRIWKVPRNNESWLITALILFLILHPASSVTEGLLLALAGILASASKFLLTWNGKHIFNPAAFAAATLSLSGLLPTAWWVGSSALWVATALVGLLIVRKIRRFPLLFAFVVTAGFLQAITFFVAGKPVILGLENALIASPLIFLSTIMLTEPATMPPRRNQQLIFGTGVGLLYAIPVSIGPLYVSSEMALLIGNIYAFVVSPKSRVRLQLKEIQKISDRVHSYIFEPDRPLPYLPGQYMEFTLAGVPFDNRGNRRTFTIASSPTEATLQVGLKYYNPTSMYKYTFSKLRPGATIYASQLAGNFTLKGNERKKLAFIAGGIGITPFRSMIKYLIDTKTSGDIILLYNLVDLQELAYKDIFVEAKHYGVTLIPITTNPADISSGAVCSELDASLIKTLIPDYRDRLFYVSGPNALVDKTKHHLQKLGIAKRSIKTDHFSGY
jgi:ferredoxin-NADP reductase